MSSFTIEYQGASQPVRVYDGKPRKTPLHFGCPASPPQGTVEVMPQSSAHRYTNRLIDALGRPPPVIDVSGMAPGPAVFSLSRFAARASDYFTANVKNVALDEQTAQEWGYQERAGPTAPGPSASISR